MDAVCRVLSAFVLGGVALVAQAGEAQIAVAANFSAPMTEILARFKDETGHEVRASFGSTGKLYAQIRNGAPFEALLAADQERPVRLENEGLAVAGSRFTYAIGSLVLWSPDPTAIDDGPAVLEAGAFNKLSIANPKLAPYGQATMQALAALGLKEAVEPKLVMGENIAQTFQFVDTGNADLGFVARSQVMVGGELSKGSGWVVPRGLHEPIRQDAVTLRRGRDNPTVSGLMAYLKSDEARSILRGFGYQSQ